MLIQEGGIWNVIDIQTTSPRSRSLRLFIRALFGKNVSPKFIELQSYGETPWWYPSTNPSGSGYGYTYTVMSIRIWMKPWSQLAHSCRRLSRFLYHEAARSISTPPGRDVIPPQFVRFPQQFAGTHLYSWVERDTVRVSCPGTQHSVPARARTWTAHSGDERTNHEAPAPPPSG